MASLLGLHQHAQYFAFCSQIVTKYIKVMFLLVSKFKNDRKAIENCLRSSPKKLTKIYNEEA